MSLKGIGNLDYRESQGLSNEKAWGEYKGFWFQLHIPSLCSTHLKSLATLDLTKECRRISLVYKGEMKG